MAVGTSLMPLIGVLIISDTLLRWFLSCVSGDTADTAGFGGASVVFSSSPSMSRSLSSRRVGDEDRILDVGLRGTPRYGAFLLGLMSCEEFLKRIISSSARPDFARLPANESRPVREDGRRMADDSMDE